MLLMTQPNSIVELFYSPTITEIQDKLIPSLTKTNNASMAKVLIVDDSQLYRFKLRKLVEAKGHNLFLEAFFSIRPRASSHSETLQRMLGASKDLFALSW